MTENLLLLVAESARVLRRAFDQRAKGRGITRQQWSALLTLARQEGCNQEQLADLLDMESISLCRMVDRLAEGSLVRRDRDPNDRRAWKLYLTREGWSLLDELRPLAQELEAAACAGLSSAQREATAAALKQITANLGTRAAAGERPVKPGPEGKAG